MERVSFNSQLRLADISVDEEMWGPGSYEVVMRWLRDEYDPDVMPRLAVSTITGREGYWLLGWNQDGTTYPPLLAMIFGPGYAAHQLDQFKAQTDTIERMKNDQLGEYGEGRGVNLGSLDGTRGWGLMVWNQLTDGGVWGVPRCGLMFQKDEAAKQFVLVQRMPWFEELSVTEAELRADQDWDIENITKMFKAVGIEVVDATEDGDAEAPVP